MTFIVQTVLLIFPHWCPGQQHMHRQETIDTTVPLTARVYLFNDAESGAAYSTLIFSERVDNC